MTTNEIAIPQLEVPRHGSVTLSGYGIKVLVDRGHLLIKDGIAANRKRVRLPRVGHGLKRLVVIGSDGMVSLAALRWLSDQNAAFVMLERDGKVLGVTGPVRPSDAKLRRSQAVAFYSCTGLRIASELISRKLQGQEQVVREILDDWSVADQIAQVRATLGERRLHRSQLGFKLVALIWIVLLHDLRADQIQFLFEGLDVFFERSVHHLPPTFPNHRSS